MKGCQDVVESSYHFMTAVKGTVIPNNVTVLTSDVKNLYPIIPNSGGADTSPRALIPVLTGRIRSCADRPSFGTLLISSKCLILGQRNSFQDVIYKNKSGIIMGLACAVAMANIYMSEVDLFVRQIFTGKSCSTRGWLTLCTAMKCSRCVFRRYWDRTTRIFIGNSTTSPGKRSRFWIWNF